MEAAYITLEGDKIKAKVNDRPSSPVSSLVQHMSRDVYSGVATLLALCADPTCSLALRVLVDVWSYFVPAGPSTSVSQFLGRNHSALLRCGDHTR